MSKRNGSWRRVCKLTPLRPQHRRAAGIRYGVDQRRNQPRLSASPRFRSRRRINRRPPTDIDAMIAQGASISGRCRRRASWTTPSCTCGSTNSRPRFWCSSRTATAPTCWHTMISSRTNKAHWLVNEIRQYWKRVLKRIDVTSRTLVTLIEPGSCFVGTLAELVFAADRSYMLMGAEAGRQPRAA